ncbi:hypothetical protein BCJMU51_3409 [Bacillus cereus]|nr:hypothetical protein A3782_22135 [Bacillus sp. GZT]BCB38487.1 hypothetical protein BCM0045_3382 [Bacillus cereus]BCC01329.1 hypothetical protein BCM0057_3411 [Bacillus cereus]BCC24836.1 hypothetical protein BCM0079_3429 [Bacillus cereus]BCC36413.1 hypothetical protein BCM0105_3403 [Bacillus cereus]
MTQKLTNMDYIIVMSVFIIYLLIAYVMNVSMLKFIIVHTDGFTVSFIGIVICYLSVVVSSNVIRKLINNK